MVNQPPPTMVTNHYGNIGHGQILFYNRDEPYYEFTNFYAAPIDLDGKTWPTTEHYFQAQKFIGTSYPEVIRNFDRPRQAFDLSRNPTVSRWRRSDWEEIKKDIMKKALLAKFTQHKRLRQMLLSTGDNMLIEHTPYDKFWGDGGDGSGQNQLGMLLMEIRHDLKTLQASLRQENDHAARSHINADSHHERVQTVRSDSTEKDGSNGLSSTLSCSMEYTNAGDDKSNQSNQGHPNQNSDLTRRPLHAGSPSHQQPAATGGEASSQVNTTTDTGTAPSQSTSKPPSDPPVGDLIDLDSEPPKEDDVTAMMTGGVPQFPAVSIQPTSSTPSQCNATTHIASECTTPAAPDTSTGAAEKELSQSNKEEEQMDTNH